MSSEYGLYGKDGFHPAKEVPCAISECKCGNDPFIGSRYRYKDTSFWIVCDSCGTSTRDHGSVNSAVNQWNRKEVRASYSDWFIHDINYPVKPSDLSPYSEAGEVVV